MVKIFKILFWATAGLVGLAILMAFIMKTADDKQAEDQNRAFQIIQERMSEPSDPLARAKAMQNENYEAKCGGNEDTDSSLGGDELGEFRVAGSKLGEITVEQASWEDFKKAPTLHLLYHQRTAALPTIKLPNKTRTEIGNTVDAFLQEWETFEPGETSDYNERLSPYMASSGAGAITTRRDSSQAEGIGICSESCSVGSRFDLSSYRPSSYMRVHYSKGDKVWATTQGVVRYTTQDIGAGEPFRREYGILLVKEGNKWRVERVASATLGRN